jgi:hypothetical protein
MFPSDAMQMIPSQSDHSTYILKPSFYEWLDCPAYSLPSMSFILDSRFTTSPVLVLVPRTCNPLLRVCLVVIAALFFRELVAL